MRLCVIHAHADDEVFGCGGMLARHKREGDYTVVVGCSFTKRTIMEWDESCKVLDVDAAYPLDFCWGELWKNEPHIQDKVRWILENERPDVVLTHAQDTHQDHCAVNRVVMRAVGALPSITVAEFESPTTSVTSAPFVPNAYEDCDIETKLRALDCYKSQAMPAPHPRSPEVVRALAVKRGSECGKAYAEAFRIVRGKL